MSQIANLVVGLTLTNEKFSRDLKSAQVSVGSFGAKMATGVASAGVAVGAALAVVATAAAGAATALGAMAIAGISRIDDLGDKAAQLGLTANSLGKLQYAAQLTGGDVESMGKALSKLNVNLGSGKIDDELQAIGLSGDKLRNMSIDEAFVEISGAISKIDSPSKKASTAMSLLGKSGLNIITTLAAGPEKLNALSQEAEKFGVAVHDIDAENIGAAQDAIDRLWKAWEGLGNTLASAVAPYLEAALTSLIEFIPSAEKIKRVIGTAFYGIGVAVGVVADMLKHLELGWLNIKSVAALAAADMIQSISGLGDAYVAMVELLTGDVIANPLVGLEADFRATAANLATTLDKEMAKRPPSESINAWVAEMNKKAGLFGRNTDLKGIPSSAKRIQQQAKPEFAVPKFSDAVVKGTQEARKLEVAARFGNKVIKSSTENQMLKTNQQQLTELQKIRQAVIKQNELAEEEIDI